MVKKLAILASKDSLDGAYTPFILASTAAALGFEVKIFFTFAGLHLLKKKIPLNPLTSSRANVLNLIPGMTWFVRRKMEQKLKQKGIANIEQLRSICIESEVEFIACQVAIELLDIKNEDFIENVNRGGAASFLEFANEADTTLHI